LSTPGLSRKAPKQRIYKVDQDASVEDGHLIKSFELFELTIWLLEQENPCMGKYCAILLAIKRLAFHQFQLQKTINIDELLHVNFSFAVTHIPTSIMVC